MSETGPGYCPKCGSCGCEGCCPQFCDECRDTHDSTRAIGETYLDRLRRCGASDHLLAIARKAVSEVDAAEQAEMEGA